MSEGVDQEKVRRDVERIFPALEPYTEDELLAEVSQLELGEEVGNPDTEVSGTDMMQAGSLFMRRGRFHDVICDDTNRSVLEGVLGVAITARNVAAVVAVLLPLLGIAAPITVPAAVVALALVLLKGGLAKYCST